MGILLNWLFRSRRERRRRSIPDIPTLLEISRPPSPPTRSTQFSLLKRDFVPDPQDPSRTWHGFVIEDERGAAISYDDRILEEVGVRIFRVAGVSYRPDALQSEAFEPGKKLKLLLEDLNPHDRNAVSVWDESQRLMVGYVPREINRSIRATLSVKPDCLAIVLAESRKDNRRVGLRVFFGPIAGMTVSE